MTATPGWYDDGVTAGVERWFDGRAWTETTRPRVPVPTSGAPVAAAVAAPVATPAAVAAASTVWVPQDVPAMPGLELAAPALHRPSGEPEPLRAPTAAAAGYPEFGTPYRPADAAAPTPAPAASPYTAAAASPYTAAAASPYTAAAASPYPAAAPSYPAATASPYPAAPSYATGATPAYADAAGYGATRFSPAGYPVPDPDVPGAGAGRWVASQDTLESAFRSAAVERATSHRQSALVMGGIAVGLLVVSAGILRATASFGTGMVWTWGFVGGAVFLVKAAMSYVKSVRGGVPHFRPVGWAVSGVALLVAVGMVVSSLVVAFSPMDVAVGSCFDDAGLEVEQVNCALPHDYTTVGVVQAVGECPSFTTVYARLDDEVVCLVDSDLGIGD